MAKVTAHVKLNKRIYIHNDIDQAAFYFRQRIESRAAQGDRDGIGLEMIACLTLLAFAVEARFNFLGFMLIEDWNERDTTLNKVNIVLESFDIKDDFKKRPYKTIVDLKTFRDTLAHGKPEVVEYEGEITATEEELKQKGRLSAEYEKFLKEELVFQAYEDVETIWADLLKRSGLDIFETITHGGIEYTILKEVEENGG
jgi:hypothetical protein